MAAEGRGRVASDQAGGEALGANGQCANEQRFCWTASENSYRAG
jgi:hypothetical protein